MRISRNSLWMFLIGLGSVTKIHVVGLLSFSEIFVFVIAPYLYLKWQREFRKVGFNTYFILIFLMMLGGLVSTLYNHSWFFAYVKYAAVIYSIFAFSVVFYVLLRNDLRGLNWFALGVLLSSIIIVWAFNPSLAVDQSIGTASLESASAQEVVSGVRFWSTRIGQALRLPIVGEMYMRTPLSYSLTAMVASVIVSMTMSISGRSDAAIATMAIILMLIGRKSRKSMASIGQHMVALLLITMIIAFLGNAAYKYCALNGMLGEHARNKYLGQTKQGDSILRLLMSGRSEFFVGMRAAIDQPIVGFGVSAVDEKGYWGDFLAKYADYDDYELYMKAIARNERHGYMPQIPVHSHIVDFWGRSGISGLLFSIYLFYLSYTFFKKYAGAIPQWYGFFAFSIPSLMWGLFFSPYGHGPGRPLLFTCILIARAVGEGKLQLPRDFKFEARRYQ